MASDQQLVMHVAAHYTGEHMLDMQVEVCLPELVAVPAVGVIGGRGRAPPEQRGSSLCLGRAGGAVGRGQARAHLGPAVGPGGAGE